MNYYIETEHDDKGCLSYIAVSKTESYEDALKYFTYEMNVYEDVSRVVVSTAHSLSQGYPDYSYICKALIEKYKVIDTSNYKAIIKEEKSRMFYHVSKN